MKIKTFAHKVIELITAMGDIELGYTTEEELDTLIESDLTTEIQQAAYTILKSDPKPEIGLLERVFYMSVRNSGADKGDFWDEKIEGVENDTEANIEAQRIINNFNATLKIGETKRKLICVYSHNLTRESKVLFKYTEDEE